MQMSHQPEAEKLGVLNWAAGSGEGPKMCCRLAFELAILTHDVVNRLTHQLGYVYHHDNVTVEAITDEGDWDALLEALVNVQAAAHSASQFTRTWDAVKARLATTHEKFADDLLAMERRLGAR